MINVKQQLLKVMTAVYNQASLNPDGLSFQMQTELFVDCPNYAPLLEKLEKQYEVIKIDQRPDERNMSDADHGMFEVEQPRNYERYMSYYITLEPTYEAFYLREFTDYEATVNRTDKNEYSDDEILVLSVVANMFVESEQKPIAVPKTLFEEAGLEFDKTKSIISKLADSKMFELVSAPSAPDDDAPYRFALPPKQLELYASVKKEFQVKRDLQMLTIYFARICNIYDATAGGYVGFEDPELNHFYSLLTIRIEDILAQDNFEDLREEMPFIYDSLLGNYEDLDISWEHMRPSLMNYFGKLEKRMLREVPGSFKLKEDEQNLLDKVDEAIAAHSQRKKKANANFLKHLDENLPKIKEEMFGSNTEPGNPLNRTPKSQKEPGTQKQPVAPTKLEVHNFEPEHYNKAKGLLMLSTSVKVSVATRGKVKRPNGQKYDQCRLIEMLFKNVNTLKSGVKFSTVLGISDANVDKAKQKKIRNIVQEINLKIAATGAPKNLIKIQNQKVFMNSSYLE